jgi:hypothetical protein
LLTKRQGVQKHNFDFIYLRSNILMRTAYASKAALLAAAFVIPAAIPLTAKAQSEMGQALNPPPPITPSAVTAPILAINPAPPVTAPPVTAPIIAVNPAPPVTAPPVTVPIIAVNPAPPVTAPPVTVPIIAVNPAPPVTAPPVTVPIIAVNPAPPAAIPTVTAPPIQNNPAPLTAPVATPVVTAPVTTPAVTATVATAAPDETTTPATQASAISISTQTTSTAPSTTAAVPITPSATVKPTRPVVPFTAKEVASSLAGSAIQAQAMLHTILDGSHHRPLMSYGGAQGAQNCFWATGDVVRGGESNPANGGLAEIGLCRDFADGVLRAGLGIGRVTQSKELDASSSKVKGNHLVGELNYKTASGLLLSALGVFADWKADLRRAYSSSNGTDYSIGTTAIKSNSMRLRADWVDAWTTGKVGLTPYAALTTSRARIVGYTETGGNFPATFDTAKNSTTTGHLGAVATFDLTGSAKLRASIEAIRRNGSGFAVSGQVPEQFTFNVVASNSPKTWMRTGVDLDLPLSRTVLLSFSLHSATKSADPRLTSSISLRAAF